VLTNTGDLRRLVGRHLPLWTALAGCLDVILIVGPSVFQNQAWGFPILVARWLVMMAGAHSAAWAYRAEEITHTARHWRTVYFVFGFTLAGVFNMLGTFRIPNL
jgi:hypothetical protein